MDSKLEEYGEWLCGQIKNLHTDEEDLEEEEEPAQ